MSRQLTTFGPTTPFSSIGCRTTCKGDQGETEETVVEIDREVFRPEAPADGLTNPKPQTHLGLLGRFSFTNRACYQDPATEISAYESAAYTVAWARLHQNLPHVAE